jgi:hypothetical protein
MNITGLQLGMRKGFLVKPSEKTGHVVLCIAQMTMACQLKHVFVLRVEILQLIFS